MRSRWRRARSRRGREVGCPAWYQGAEAREDRMRVGYAAFLDVLGFSALISGDQGARVEKYLGCLKEVFDREPPSMVDYVVFSDSIILTTPDDSLPAFQELEARCSTLLWVMLRSDIALRGAIAHGPYITEK